MSKIKPISTIMELKNLCDSGDKQEQYKKLTKLSAENLGYYGKDVTSAHIQWLTMNAMETNSEEGVVDEINFCLDLV